MPQNLAFELLVKCHLGFTCSELLGPPHCKVDWLFVDSCWIHLQRAFEGESVFEVLNLLLRSKSITPSVERVLKLANFAALVRIHHHVLAHVEVCW